jgi:hypothetical protein
MSQTRIAKDWERAYDAHQLHGHANVRADICFACNGKLIGADGSHCEALFDDGVVAFAAAICRSCKDKEKADTPR